MGIKVGLQVFSIKESMAENPAEAIACAAKAGYRYLEAANHKTDEDAGIGAGLKASELKKILEEAGAEMVSAHIAPLKKENFKRILEYHAEIENHNLVYPIGSFQNYDDLMNQCELFNEFGELAGTYGIRFHYHNHAHEFMTMDARLVLDLLMKHTDPDKMGLEADTYWIMRGGLDPLEVIWKYRNRISMLHQKDMSKTIATPVNVFEKMERETGDGRICDFNYWKPVTSDEDFTEIGTGTMDIQNIIDLANEIGSVEYLFLEQDATRMNSEFDSIRRSMEEFRKYRGIAWKTL